MAAYTVAVGDIGKYEIAVAANTEDTVTFGGGAGDAAITDLSQVEIQQVSGAKPVYYCFGSTAATVRGAHCRAVYPGTTAKVSPPTSGDTVVRLISEAAAVVSVSIV
jgi:hypothetical protein